MEDEVDTCNHQGDSPLDVWPVWSGALQAQRKREMVIHDTKCPYWDQVVLLVHYTNSLFLLSFLNEASVSASILVFSSFWYHRISTAGSSGMKFGIYFCSLYCSTTSLIVQFVTQHCGNFSSIISSLCLKLNIKFKSYTYWHLSSTDACTGLPAGLSHIPSTFFSPIIMHSFLVSSSTYSLALATW